jgi:hypothetical protein
LKGKKIPPPEDTVERIGLTELHPLKCSSRTYYVTINPKVVHAYGLVPHDLLKVTIIEVRKHREKPDE